MRNRARAGEDDFVRQTVRYLAERVKHVTREMLQQVILIATLDTEFLSKQHAEQ